MKVEIDTSDLKKLDSVVNEIIKQSPKKTRQFLKNEARAVNRLAKKIARSRLKTRRTNPKDKTSYMKGFKSSKVFKGKANSNDRGIKAYNKAYHSHLVEDGHVVKVGNKKGRKQRKSPIENPKTGEHFVKGLHIIRDSERLFSSIYEQDVIDFAKETIEEVLNK